MSWNAIIGGADEIKPRIQIRGGQERVVDDAPSELFSIVATANRILESGKIDRMRFFLEKYRGHSARSITEATLKNTLSWRTYVDNFNAWCDAEKRALERIKGHSRPISMSIPCSNIGEPRLYRIIEDTNEFIRASNIRVNNIPLLADNRFIDYKIEWPEGSIGCVPSSHTETEYRRCINIFLSDLEIIANDIKKIEILIAKCSDIILTLTNKLNHLH